MQRLRRAVVELYPDGELLSGGNRGQRILSRRLASFEPCGETSVACKRKIERQVERGPGLRFFLDQTGQPVLIVAAAEPTFETGKRLDYREQRRRSTARILLRCFYRLGNIGSRLLRALPWPAHRTEKSRFPNSCRCRRRNLFRGRLCPWLGAGLSPPACNRCSDRRGPPSSLPHPAKAGDAVLPSRTGCMTSPARDSHARC